MAIYYHEPTAETTGLDQWKDSCSSILSEENVHLCIEEKIHILYICLNNSKPDSPILCESVYVALRDYGTW